MANCFLLGSALDWRIPSELAWQNADRLVKEILGDPDDLWQTITSVSHSEWKSKHDKYQLHWLHAAHDRLWRIEKRICDEYSGDARRIWEGRNSSAALEALWDVGAGQQISRMIVGALRDCGQIRSRKSDVKGDIYVRHVLGRAVLGETTDAEMAVKLAGQMHPEDPWQLDAQLWEADKKWCHPNNPNCSQCYLSPHCAYALSRT
jgi:endonuclease-3